MIQQNHKCKRVECDGDMELKEYICRVTLAENSKSITSEILEFTCPNCGLKHSFESQKAAGFFE